MTTLEDKLAMSASDPAPERLNADWHTRHRLARSTSEVMRLAWHIAHSTHCGCRAMPPASAAIVAGFEPPRIRTLLERGERLHVADVQRVLALVHAQPTRVAELTALALDDDPTVAARALELLAKLADDHCRQSPVTDGP